ncbi:hypothetical protein GBA63_16630 [Rubrobacter tropicus]|uniref:EfeO-type cupredoxin-like domain-containing protein n=1 Tax=Rubrobacter tropicus TaxID=2653851 RepID=A0A6G8QCC4_9ACTN|nr:hypothetical protein [Rubrobacter tropicus]QIN84088.1 hypothetical protein GBA63_16630 [Rubrobacter tropicus]
MVRLLVAFAVVVVLVGLFLVLRPDPRAAGSRERTFEVFVEDGGMVPRELRVGEGDRVTLEVGADEPVELHIHGHGVELDAGPGGGAVVAFKAGLTGRFGIENHRSGREVGTLVVGPR